MKLRLAKLDTNHELITDPYNFKAQYNDESVVVYQAFRPETADFAVENQKLGGDYFSFNRITWIKSSFLWMMYRSDWGRKKDQEHILAIHIRRDFFDSLIENGVRTSYFPKLYHSKDEWRKKLKKSDILIQMDPDRDHLLQKLDRKAIQIGLRRMVLRSYASDTILNIEDITDFVHEQYKYRESKEWDKLYVPLEKPYSL